MIGEFIFILDSERNDEYRVGFYNSEFIYLFIIFLCTYL